MRRARCFVSLAVVVTACGAVGCAASYGPPPNAPASLVELSSEGGPREVVLSVTQAQAIERVHARWGDTVAIVLPAYDAGEWRVARTDRGLGAPREETIPAWLGPEVSGQKFTWSTASLPASASDYAIEFVDKRGTTRENVTLHLEAQAP